MQTSARPALFVLPDVVEDLRQLPSTFVSRRLLWIPLALFLIGAVLGLNAHYLWSWQERIIGHYLDLFFRPPAIPTFLIAGLVAPRAGYLVGLVYGLAAGLVWTGVILSQGFVLSPLGMPTTIFDPLAVTLNTLALGVICGLPTVLLGRLVARVSLTLRRE
jgi:hypothetical protein